MADLTLPRPLVKICGLREPEHARATVAAGADLLGFMFAPRSKRKVDAETARKCIAAAREVARKKPFFAVGVFADAAIDEMNEIVDAAGLDLLQVHGNHDPSIGSRLRCPYIPAFHPAPGESASDINSLLSIYATSECPPVAFHIDGYHPEHPGGQGIQADWALVKLIADSFPVVLAGGLNAENVAGAIRTVMPIGVDVSSGVETDHRKDVDKIEKFIGAARVGFDSVGD